MGSDPEIALTNIIIPESSNDIQKRTIEEIIDGANSVFGAEGVKIVGGHTSLGKELVIGFTLGGFSKNQPKTVDKASVGDQIILTKPLGSGVLLAGEMRFEGEGQDLKNLFDAMSKSQSSIAKVLSKVANSRCRKGEVLGNSWVKWWIDRAWFFVVIHRVANSP